MFRFRSWLRCWTARGRLTRTSSTRTSPRGVEGNVSQFTASDTELLEIALQCEAEVREQRAMEVEDERGRRLRTPCRDII